MVRVLGLHAIAPGSTLRRFVNNWLPFFFFHVSVKFKSFLLLKIIKSGVPVN